MDLKKCRSGGRFLNRISAAQPQPPCVGYTQPSPNRPPVSGLANFYLPYCYQAEPSCPQRSLRCLLALIKDSRWPLEPTSPSPASQRLRTSTSRVDCQQVSTL